MDQINNFIMHATNAVSATFESSYLTSDDKYQWLFNFVQVIVYVLTIQGVTDLCTMCYNMLNRRLKTDWLNNVMRFQLVNIACIVFLVSNNQRCFAEDFPLIFIGYLIVEYPEVMDKSKSTINYGVGMACNFYEGYLMIVIPSDGSKFGGLVHNIHAFESREGVVVPVKKLFIVITKSLYCPPDLQLFNKANRDDLPKLEACTEPIPYEVADDDLFQSLDDVEKEIGGVKNRSYKNSTYRIYRPQGPPVSLVAECATPLHTLYRVTKNQELYEDFAEVDVEQVIHDFCTTLNSILSKSSECRDRVELVFYDDSDPESNLADVLLDRIRQLQPKFEELISVRK